LVLNSTLLPSTPDQLEEVHEYEPGKLLPSSSTYNGGLRFEYRNYRPGGRLPEIPAWPRPESQLSPSTWAGLMFPGEDSDPFRLGISHVGIVQQAASKSDGLRSLLDRGCMQSYVLNLPRPESGSSALPGVLPTRKTIAVADFVAIGEDGRGRSIEAEVTRDTIEGIDVQVVRDEPTVHTPGCSELRNAPWPSQSADGFLTRADSLHLQTGRLLFFSWTLKVHVLGADRSPQQGIALMQVHYVPPYVDENQSFGSFDTFAVTGWMEQGRFLNVYASPGDIAKQ
jgi:hypothetical protein